MKKRVLTILAVGVSLLILTACNGMKYDKAQSNYEAGEYSQAAEAFLALGDHEDSEEMYKESTFQYAKSLIEGKEYQAAIDILTQLDYEGVQAQYRLAIPLRVEQLCDENKFDEAASFLDKIENGVLDKTTLHKDIQFKNASYLLENKEYDKATEMFETLSKQYYPLARDMWAESIKQHAQSYLDAKKYDDAKKKIDFLLKQASIHSKSGEMGNELSYALVEAYIEDSDYENALAILENLNWGDTEPLKKDVKYKLGLEKFDKGEYEDAVDLLRGNSHADATAKFNEAAYILAKEAFESEDYKTALGYFEEISAYQDAGEYYKILATTTSPMTAPAYNNKTGNNYSTYSTYSSNLYTPSQPLKHYCVAIVSSDTESWSSTDGPSKHIVSRDDATGDYPIEQYLNTKFSNIIDSIQTRGFPLVFTDNPDHATVAIFCKITYPFQDTYRTSTNSHSMLGYGQKLSMTAVNLVTKEVIATYDTEGWLSNSINLYSIPKHYAASLPSLLNDDDFTTFVKAITNTME